MTDINTNSTTAHDALCPYAGTVPPHGGVSETCGYCERIATVRADEAAKWQAVIEERNALLDGWIAERKRLQHILTELREQVHEEQVARQREVEATAKWCREDERETIAAAIEAAHKAAPDCGPCAYEQAARIARNGGRDE